jgi:uncharacterized protein (TIGR03083 family)
VNETVCGVSPILCAHLLPKVDEALVDLLVALPPDEWRLPTIVPSWTVHEIAAHLLDTALRKLSVVRDGWQVAPPDVASPQGLVAFVNRMNAAGVAVYGRLSPPVLVDMMREACAQSARFHASLDPFGQAAFAVSWAGEQQSLNWFDTARELTERWHHQQQIRLATNRPGIMVPDLFHPVLDCFVRGLPFLYRDVDAPAGTAVALEITGECGGRWSMVRGTGAWGFADTVVSHPVCRVAMPQETAWRIFTKGLDRESARRHVVIDGDAALGERVLSLTAIVG